MLKRIQLVLILSVLAFSSAFADGTLIAILETVGDKKVDLTIKRKITGKILSEAAQFFRGKSHYRILGKDNFKDRLPQNTSLESCVNECAVEIGKIINVDYIVESFVDKVEEDYSLNIVVHDVSDAGVAGAAALTAPNVSLLEKDIADTSDALYGKIIRKPWSGVQVVGKGTNEFLNQNFVQKKIVKVESTPNGASLSIDDVVATDCPETPCIITLEEGEHTFSFSLKLYAPQSKKETIKENNQAVKVSLVPTFGILRVAPKLTEGIGKIEDLEVTFDRKKKSRDEYGSIIVPDFVQHPVTIKHKCYEDLNVKVGFNKGGQEHIIDLPMQVSQSILDLTVINQNDEPIAVDVYANGEKKGQSPFKGYVPTCSKITVGPFRESVPLSLKKNGVDTTTYKYKGNSSYPDNRDRYNKKIYNLVSIGNDVWFGENLKYKLNSNCKGSSYNYKCYYSYSDALEACPDGFHMATKDDWNALLKVQDGLELLVLTYDGQYSSNPDDGYPTQQGTDEYDIFWLENKGFIYRRPGESARMGTIEAENVENYRFPVRCVMDK